MALTISFVLRDFAEWTSIPGPIQIIYALNSFIRFLWIIIWLSLFGVFVYEFYLIVDKLMKQEAEIDISIDFKPMQEDARGERIYLPTTRAAGIRMLIDYENHDPGLIDAFGLNCPVGRDVSIAMRLFKTELMPEPYGKCVEEVNGKVAYNFYPNNTYTLQSCLRSCVQLLCINTCGCANPRYNKPADAKYCTFHDIDCLIQVQSHRRTDYNFSAVRDCDCHPPCDEFTVDTSMSSAQFPSANMRLSIPMGAFKTSRSSADELLLATKSATERVIDERIIPSAYDDDVQEYEIHEHYSCMPGKNDAFGGDVSRCLEWFAENALMLNVWYRGMDVETKTQKSSYSISQASNDLGGQVSLWLGASVISVLEIITLVFMILLFFVYGQNVRVLPSKQEYDMDPRYTHIQELKRELDEHERMDHELLARIERQRRAETERRAAMTREIHAAHALAQRTVGEARAAHEVAVADPKNTMARANAANAMAVARATERHLHKLHKQFQLTFGTD